MFVTNLKWDSNINSNNLNDIISTVGLNQFYQNYQQPHCREFQRDYKNSKKLNTEIWLKRIRGVLVWETRKNKCEFKIVKYCKARMS
jgi:hypothetical protein